MRMLGHLLLARGLLILAIARRRRIGWQRTSLHKMRLALMGLTLKDQKIVGHGGNPVKCAAARASSAV